MALKPCKECKQEVSTKAKSCPNCGAKNPTVSGKETAKGCLAFIILFAVLTVIITSCSDDSEQTEQDTQPTQPTNQAENTSSEFNKVLQISDTSMRDKPARSISFGKDGNNFCTITLFQSSIYNGYKEYLNNEHSGNISANCNIDNDYLVTSSKHPTKASIVINEIDPNTKEATITAALKVVSSKTLDSYYTLPETPLTISGDLYAALVSNISHDALKSEFITVDDSNVDDLTVEIINLYLENFALLIDRYKAYKDLDRSVFILWRNNEWVPSFDKHIDVYENASNNNKKYFASNNIYPLVSSLTNLKLISLNIMMAIRDSDPSKLEKAKEQFKTEMLTFSKFIDDKQLQDRIIFPDM